METPFLSSPSVHTQHFRWLWNSWLVGSGVLDSSELEGSYKKTPLVPPSCFFGVG